MNTVPQKSGGLYWAKFTTDKDYTLVTHIVGEAPFLKVRAWDLVHNVVFMVSEPSEIIWGPQILRPGETNAMREA